MVIHFLFFVAIMFADVVAIHINSIFSIWMYGGLERRKIDKKRSQNTENVTCYACTVTLTRSLMTILQSRGEGEQKIGFCFLLLPELIGGKNFFESSRFTTGKIVFFPVLQMKNRRFFFLFNRQKVIFQIRGWCLFEGGR
jgi:hypothetical protein